MGQWFAPRGGMAARVACVARVGLALAVAGVGVIAAGSQVGASGTAARRAAVDPYVAHAQAVIKADTARVTHWDGPIAGPKAQHDKLIVFVSATQQNGGIFGVSAGVQQAAAKIGWKVKIIDGQGTVAGQTQALNQALALKPNGIIMGGLDATSQKANLQKAAALGIKVVGWHAGPLPGPIQSPPVFTNIGSSAQQTAMVTADYAIATSNGTAQVVILTDSEYSVAVLKSSTMRREIQKCKACSVLSYEDTPISEASTRMPQLTTSLRQRFGGKLTWMLAINDAYFDFAAPALRSDGVGPAGPPVFVSAGDGSVSAYGRIRAGQYQVATVPEPLNLHGWQCIDELNRAFAGVRPSGYVTPIHLVTKANVGADGGPKNVFDPDNGYRAHYTAIWGVR